MVLSRFVVETITRILYVWTSNLVLVMTIQQRKWNLYCHWSVDLLYLCMVLVNLQVDYIILRVKWVHHQRFVLKFFLGTWVWTYLKINHKQNNCPWCYRCGVYEALRGRFTCICSALWVESLVFAFTRSNCNLERSLSIHCWCLVHFVLYFVLYYVLFQWCGNFKWQRI